jgi:hypothetical protein
LRCLRQEAVGGKTRPGYWRFFPGDPVLSQRSTSAQGLHFSAAPPRLGAFAVLALGLLLTGCETMRAPTAATAPPPRPTYEAIMGEAHAAAKAGQKSDARKKFREAAESFPTAKEPWLKLTEGYFEDTDYGNAILAAQEVNARDPADRTAHSVLAVAGLRVASTALVALRSQSTGLPDDTRSQAASITKTLRDTLGERDLVPRVDPAPRSPTRPTNPPTKGSTAPVDPAAMPGTKAATKPATTTPPQNAPAAPAKPATNPFAKIQIPKR